MPRLSSADLDRATPDTLNALCLRLRSEPSAIHAELCRAAARFLAGRGERWCGYSSPGDYAVERLGVPVSTFYSWARQGRLLEEAPEVSQAHHSGLLTDSALALIAAHLEPAAAEAALARLLGLPIRRLKPELKRLAAQGVDARAVEALAAAPPADAVHTSHPPPTANPEPEAHRQVVRQSFPAPLAPYVEGTLHLAEALVGQACDDDARWTAVLAEASTEVDVSVSAREAAHRFSHRKVHRAARLPRPAPSRPQRTKALSRGKAHRADQHLRRLIARRRRRRMHLEDALLTFQLTGAWQRLGHRSVTDFARQRLGLSATTGAEYLARARSRRADDPITRAHDRGEIGASAVLLLRGLQRMGVPRGDLPRWVGLAAGITVRSLRERIEWARRRVREDYRAWVLRGCPPPDDDELRMSRMSLRRLASRPELPDLKQTDHLPELPRATLSWVLEEETTAFLHQLSASLMDRHGCGAWQSMVLLCRLARGAWAAGIPARAPRKEVVLDRDDWRCAVPGCSRRRGLQKHHVHMLSHGGGDEIENLITLCAFHHQIGVHQGLLLIRGRADRGGEDLTFVLGLRPGRRPLQVFRGEHRRPRSSVPLPAGKAWSMV